MENGVDGYCAKHDVDTIPFTDLIVFAGVVLVKAYIVVDFHLQQD